MSCFMSLRRLAACATLGFALLGAGGMSQGLRAETDLNDAPAGDESIAKMLTGKFVGEGAFVDRASGNTRGIKLDIRGNYDGKKLILVEDTLFSDGESQHKVWTFTRDDAGEWVGHRPDVIGAARVKKTGQNLAISYKAHVLKDGRTLDLTFDESYDIKNPNLITSETQVSYLFLTVGKADLTIRRTGP